MWNIGAYSACDCIASEEDAWLANRKSARTRRPLDYAVLRLLEMPHSTFDIFYYKSMITLLHHLTPVTEAPVKKPQHITPKEINALNLRHNLGEILDKVANKRERFIVKHAAFLPPLF